MAQVDEKPALNNSSRGVVDTEKATTVHGIPEESQLDFFDDPDEGLSEEEKAKIVSNLPWSTPTGMMSWTNAIARIVHYCGNLICGLSRG